MKFWCASANSSKQQKSNNKRTTKSIDTISSSASYATISSIPAPKSDSGYSETASSIVTYSCLEHILIFERTHHENLKKFIIKYSRPLRRYLATEEIVDLFQNIEKISAISESIVRQCDKLLDENNASQLPISMIYESMLGVMIDSYSTYISRNAKARFALAQFQNKIAYFLQLPIELVAREVSEFIQLPMQHIYILNDFLQSFVNQNASSMNSADWKILENIGSLSKQIKHAYTLTDNDQSSMLESSQDTTFLSDISPVLVLQRKEKEPWELRRLELTESHLSFTENDRASTICLSNVVHIEESGDHRELCMTVASKKSKFAAVKMLRVYIRFDDENDYLIWLEYLTIAIQDAKDRTWTNKNELFI